MKQILLLTSFVLTISVNAQEKHYCDGNGFLTMNDVYMHYQTGKWVNDSIGCVTIESFKKKINGKWIDIPKCQYYYENKDACFEYSVNGNQIIPCCGHIHKVNPSKEIKQ